MKQAAVQILTVLTVRKPVIALVDVQEARDAQILKAVMKVMEALSVKVNKMKILTSNY